MPFGGLRALHQPTDRAGQSHGGITQEVGQAMWEECALDPASGQPLCGSFMDYGMPRSDNLPSFGTEIVEVLSPTNPFGIKAGGEGGCTPALAVVVSAILDALAPLGVTRHHDACHTLQGVAGDPQRQRKIGSWALGSAI
jgi:CO/xanthine dehydrogenase Mo-binding subunit